MIYENLTDDELIRAADGHAGLVKALSERLEMRLRDVEELNITPSKIRQPNPNQPDLFEESQNA
jgi:hypothetical protein